MRLNKILAATAVAALLAVGVVNRFLATSALAQNAQTGWNCERSGRTAIRHCARVCCS